MSVFRGKYSRNRQFFKFIEALSESFLSLFEDSLNRVGSYNNLCYNNGGYYNGGFL